MATARTIPAIRDTFWGTDGTATAAIQNGHTPVAYGTARNPTDQWDGHGAGDMKTPIIYQLSV